MSLTNEQNKTTFREILQIFVLYLFITLNIYFKLCKINVLNAEISFSEAKTLSLLIPLGLWQIGKTQITNNTTG